MKTDRKRLVVGKATCPQLKPHVHLRFDQIRQAWVVLGPEHIYWPDEPSVAILQQLDGTRRVDEIIEALSGEFDASPDIIGPDVIGFLQIWADERLISAPLGYELGR